MVVDKGYKQTEIGIIPENWDIKSLRDIVLFFNGKAHENNITETGQFEVVNSKFISSNGTVIKYSSQNYCELNKDDITIVMSDIPNGKALAKCFIIPENKKYALNQRIGGLRTKNGIPKYLYYQLNRNNYFLSFDSGSGQTNLRKQEILDCPIILPPLPEQTAIASALSDMDELIAQTEKLIEKKKAIKQGVMQELLSPTDKNGKLKEGWVRKKLSEVAIFRRGSFPQPYGLDKWYDDLNGQPFVQVFDVDDNKRLKSETKRYISKEAQIMSVFAPKGTIVLTIQGSIGRIAITQYDAFIDRTLLIFESYLVPFDPYFFMLKIHQLFDYEKQNAPGGIIKTITKEALSSFNISYPPLEYQKRIGTILIDIENEIILIENKLQKLKLQKQGMMQSLLKGKIRLV
jgi:type I restriction enzyme S subunit